MSTPPKKNALRNGALAHYADAAYYDRIYRRRRHDVAYYAELAGSAGGAVLELGCGSGRVTLAMAQAGASVVGVDPSAPMLRAAEDKRERAPRAVRERLRFVGGDMRRVRLGQRFALVVAPFNVFMHLYTRSDVERALETVHLHLRGTGKLVFDVSAPDYRALLRDPHRVYRGKDLTHPESGVRLHYEEVFGHDPRSQVQTVSMIFTRADDDSDVHVTPLSQRLFYPAELEALLHYNDFTLESLSGDFRERGLYSGDESMLVVARPRRKKPR